MSDRRYMPLREAAAIADCHPRTIKRAGQRGELRVVQLGATSALRVEIASFERWLRPVPADERRGAPAEVVSPRRPPARGSRQALRALEQRRAS